MDLLAGMLLGLVIFALGISGPPFLLRWYRGKPFGLIASLFIAWGFWLLFIVARLAYFEIVHGYRPLGAAPGILWFLVSIWILYAKRSLWKRGE